MDFFTKDNITLLISILGACAWLPIIIEKFRKPQILCKILKYDWLENGKYQYYVPFEAGLVKEVNGTNFIILMRCISLKNDFFLSEFKVRVKFESLSNEVDAHIYFTPNIEVKNLNKTFFSDIGCNVLYCPILKKDESYDLEIQCIVENKRTDIEYVKFIFIDDKKKEQIVKMKKAEFKDAIKIFE